MEPEQATRRQRSPAILAALATALLIAGVGYGLWRLTVWLSPGPIELPPEAVRQTPGLQRFVPVSDRRLLAKIDPTPDSEDAPLVPADHPFAKTKVTGRVYDLRTQEGVPDAEVRVWPAFGKPKLGDSPTGEARVRTRSDGSFALKGLPPGIFALEVSAPGYVSVESGIEKYSAVEDDDGFDIGLIPGRSLEGRVVDSGGRPVPGAEVFLLEDRGFAFGGQAPEVTDAEGRFSVDAIPNEGTELLATHPSQGSGLGRVAPGSDPASVEVVLGAERTCEGVVSGPDGPIAGARIVPHMAGLGGGAVFFQPTKGREALVTGADGTFRWAISGPTAGAFVTAPGYVRKVVGVHEEGACKLDVRLDRAFTLRGQVLSSGGEPVQKARVEVSVGIDGRSQRFADAETDAAGRFEMPDAPAEGPYEVRILHPEHPPFSSSEVSLGGERIFRLDEAVRLMGKLVDAKRGGPITRYHYEVMGPMQRRGEAFSVSGALEVTALIPGHYLLRVAADGYEPTTAEVDLSGGAPREVVVALPPAGTIVGQVSAPGGGELIVQAWDAEGGLAAESSVGGDGAFSLTNLAQGEYRLNVFGHDGDELVLGSLEGVRVERGEVTRGIRIPVSRERSPDSASRPVF